jgi:hypothetical protein
MIDYYVFCVLKADLTIWVCGPVVWRFLDSLVATHLARVSISLTS